MIHIITSGISGTGHIGLQLALHGTIHGGADITHGTDHHGTGTAGITATGTILGPAVHGMIHGTIHGMDTVGTTHGTGTDGIRHLILLMQIMEETSIMENAIPALLMKEDPT